jgi:hypothetical protein
MAGMHLIVRPNLNGCQSLAHDRLLANEHLLRDPFRRRVVRHIKVQDLAAAMSEHDKDVWHFERDRRPLLIPFGFERRAQNLQNRSRCHRMTVSG